MHEDQLIEFVTVARTGSLAAAALKLSVSQSSLSRHMQELETRLGLQLLERRSNGVVLTDDGRYVFGRAADMADIVDDIHSYAMRRSKGLKRVVTVYGVAELPAYVRAFAQALNGAPHASAPKARFPRHADLGSKDVGDLLARGDIDIAVLRPTELRDDFNGRFAISKFCDEGVVAMVESSHPLAARFSVAIEELENCLFLHADSHYDQARHAWLEFKALLRSHHVPYRAESCGLDNTADWFMAPPQGIVPLTAAHNMIPLLREMGRACVAIDNVRYTYYAVCRPDDTYARAVVSLAAKMLGQVRGQMA